MLFRLPQSVKNAIKDYSEALEKYLSGKIAGDYFKGIRVPFGFYSHRGGKVLMARIQRSCLSSSLLMNFLREVVEEIP